MMAVMVAMVIDLAMAVVMANVMVVIKFPSTRNRFSREYLFLEYPAPFFYMN